MKGIGTAESPLRVAIVGAGPAGFYAAEHLLRSKDIVVEVDIYDRLPTPYGLVRSGVAPDHQKIKGVTKIFDRTAANPRLRYFGNVTIGRHLTVEDLTRYYHQIVFTYGSSTDRTLNIPGIDLKGSHSATEFVAWYNGHPDYVDRPFDLSQTQVAIIGVGNVAVDVARILARTVEELAETDIANYALNALRQSQVKEITMLGRRGLAQAAFTAPEAKELGELPGADIIVDPADVELDPLSVEALGPQPEKAVARMISYVQGFAEQAPEDKPRRLAIRFLVSPTEILGDENGNVTGLKLARNRLVKDENGRLRPEATGETEVMAAGLVFRSVGYAGMPLAGVPFDERRRTILNEGGRILDPASSRPRAGFYTAGWIKRGPTGVIGTNKADAAETVAAMLADAAAGCLLEPAEPTVAAVEAHVSRVQPAYFSYDDWLALDAAEVARAGSSGRPRVKITSVTEMLKAIGR